MIGGGLTISRSLAVFLRLASPSEFVPSLAVSSGAVIAIAAGAGYWDPMFIWSLAACGLAA
jgi:hypothetical protein